MQCHARILNGGKGGRCPNSNIKGDYCTKHENQFQANRLKFGDIRVSGKDSIPLNPKLAKKLFGSSELVLDGVSKDRADEILCGCGSIVYIDENIFRTEPVRLDRVGASRLIANFVVKRYLTRLYLPIIEMGREVYRELGWGWQESVYREAMMIELRNKNYKCSEEVYQAIPYKNGYLSNVCGRIDILVDLGRFGMIIELKSDSANKTSMTKACCQCQRYMRIMKYKYGLVINFPEKNNREIEYMVITYFGGEFREYKL